MSLNNRFIKYALVGASALTIGASAGFVNQYLQSHKVLAESRALDNSTLYKGFKNNHLESANPSRIGGKYVFCLEPSITSFSPYYKITGDAVAGGYQLWYESDGSDSGRYWQPNDDHYWSLVVPYVLSYMDASKVEEAFGADVRAFRDEVANMSGGAWYSSVQLGIWANLEQISGIPSSVEFVSGDKSSVDAINNVLSSGFISKWKSATSKIVSVLKKGGFERNGEFVKISYNGGANMWTSDENNQRLYTIEDISLTWDKEKEKPKPPTKLRVRKKLAEDAEELRKLGVEQYSVEGAVYELLKNGTPIQTSTTDAEGYAKFEVPAATYENRGTYTVREKTPPKPKANGGVEVLTLDEAIINVGKIYESNPYYNDKGIHMPSLSDYSATFNDNTEVVSNEKRKPPVGHKIKVKKNGDIKETAFGATLAGAVFNIQFSEIAKDNVLFSISYKTDASGNIDLNDSSAVVNYGTGAEIAKKMVQNGFVGLKAKISEVTPPPGFLIDDGVYKDFPLNFNATETTVELSGSISFNNTGNELILSKYQRNNSKLGGTPIDGAEFSLSGTGGSKTAVATNGELHFYNVTPGTYKLKETKAPQGYQLNENEMTVSVAANGGIGYSGNTTYYNVKDLPYMQVGFSNGAFNVFVEDTPNTANFDLKKINEKNSSLENAKFSLTQISSPVDKSSVVNSQTGSSIQHSFDEKKNVPYYLYRKNDTDKDNIVYDYVSFSSSTELGLFFENVQKGEYKIFEKNLGYSIKEKDVVANQDSVYSSFTVDKQGVVSDKYVKDNTKMLNQRVTTKYVKDDPKTKDKNEEVEAKSTFSILAKQGLSDDIGISTDANGLINFTPKLKNSAGEDGLIIGAQYMLEETEAPKGYKLPRVRKRFYFTVNTNPNNNQYQIDYRFDTLDKTSNSNEDWIRGEEKTVSLGEKIVFNTPSESRELIQAPEETDTVTMSLDSSTKKLSVNYQAMNRTRDKLPATGSSVMLIALSIGVAGLAGTGFYKFRVEK
jgi:cna B domain protein